MGDPRLNFAVAGGWWMVVGGFALYLLGSVRILDGLVCRIVHLALSFWVRFVISGALRGGGWLGGGLGCFQWVPAGGGSTSIHTSSGRGEGVSAYLRRVSAVWRPCLTWITVPSCRGGGGVFR